MMNEITVEPTDVISDLLRQVAEKSREVAFASALAALRTRERDALAAQLLAAVKAAPETE